VILELLQTNIDLGGTVALARNIER